MQLLLYGMYIWLTNTFRTLHDRIIGDPLDHCPMPINANQNSGIDPNVNQSMPWIWSALIGIDRGSIDNTFVVSHI